jgi:hypothetical protein
MKLNLEYLNKLRNKQCSQAVETSKPSALDGCKAIVLQVPVGKANGITDTTPLSEKHQAHNSSRLESEAKAPV